MAIPAPVEAPRHASLPTKTVTIVPLDANDARTWGVANLSADELKDLHDDFKVNVVHKSIVTGKEKILKEDHSIAKLRKFSPAVDEAVISSGHNNGDIAKIVIPTHDMKGLAKTLQYMDMCIAEGCLDAYGKEYKNPMSTYLAVKRAADALGMNDLTDEMVGRLKRMLYHPGPQSKGNTAWKWNPQISDVKEVYRATAPDHWYRDLLNKAIVFAWLDRKLRNEKDIDMMWKEEEFWIVGAEMNVIQEAEEARREDLGMQVRGSA